MTRFGEIAVAAVGTLFSMACIAGGGEESRPSAQCHPPTALARQRAAPWPEVTIQRVLPGAPPLVLAQGRNQIEIALRATDWYEGAFVGPGGSRVFVRGVVYVWRGDAWQKRSDFESDSVVITEAQEALHLVVLEGPDAPGVRLMGRCVVATLASMCGDCGNNPGFCQRIAPGSSLVCGRLKYARGAPSSDSAWMCRDMEEAPADRIELAPGDKSLGGTVRWPDGSAAVGARVSLGGTSVVTDGAGRFFLDRVPSGQLVLRVEGARPPASPQVTTVRVGVWELGTERDVVLGAPESCQESADAEIPDLGATDIPVEAWNASECSCDGACAFFGDCCSTCIPAA